MKKDMEHTKEDTMTVSEAQTQEFDDVCARYRAAISRLDDELKSRFFHISQVETLFCSERHIKIHAVFKMLNALYQSSPEPEHAQWMTRITTFFNLLCSVAERSESLSLHDNDNANNGYQYMVGDSDFFASNVFKVSIAQIVKHSNILDNDTTKRMVEPFYCNQCVSYYDVVSYGLVKVNAVLDAGEWESMFHSYIHPLEVVYLYSVITRTIMDATGLSTNRTSKLAIMSRQTQELDKVASLIDGNHVIESDLRDFSQGAHHEALGEVGAFTNSSAEKISQIVRDSHTMNKKDLDSPHQIVEVAHYVVFSTAWAIFSHGMMTPGLFTYSGTDKFSWVFEIIDTDYDNNFNGAITKKWASTFPVVNTVRALTGKFDIMAFASYDGLARRRDLTASDTGLSTNSFANLNGGTKGVPRNAESLATQNFDNGAFSMLTHRKYSGSAESYGAYHVLKKSIKNPERVFGNVYVASDSERYLVGIIVFSQSSKAVPEMVVDTVKSAHGDLTDDEQCVASFLASNSKKFPLTSQLALDFGKEVSAYKRSVPQGESFLYIYQNVLTALYAKNPEMLVPLSEKQDDVSAERLKASIRTTLREHLNDNVDAVVDLMTSLFAHSVREVVDALTRPEAVEDVVEFARMVSDNIDHDIKDADYFTSTLWHERCRMMFYLCDNRVDDFLLCVFSFLFRTWNPDRWYFVYSILMLVQEGDDSYVTSWYNVSPEVQSDILGITTNDTTLV